MHEAMTDQEEVRQQLQEKTLAAARQQLAEKDTAVEDARLLLQSKMEALQEAEVQLRAKQESISRLEAALRAREEQLAEACSTVAGLADLQAQADASARELADREERLRDIAAKLAAATEERSAARAELAAAHAERSRLEGGLQAAVASAVAARETCEQLREHSLQLGLQLERTAQQLTASEESRYLSALLIDSRLFLHSKTAYQCYGSLVMTFMWACHTQGRALCCSCNMSNGLLLDRADLEAQYQETLARLEQQEERTDEVEQTLQRLHRLDVSAQNWP
jgi:chromosome segregation ATPase